MAAAGKNVEVSWRCDEVVGQDGDELLARFRLRFGVRSVEELLGIQPMRSSGDSSAGCCFFIVSSKVPMSSSSGMRAPGVLGKVFACGSWGVLLTASLAGAVTVEGAVFEAASTGSVGAAGARGAVLDSCTTVALWFSTLFCSLPSNRKAFSLALVCEVAGIGGFGGGALWLIGLSEVAR